MKENEAKTQNKTPSKGKSVFMKVLNTIINILIVLVLVVSLLIAVMALSSKSTGVSTVFGNTFQPIQSDSMKGTSPDGYPGGDFGKGDLMIGKATDQQGSGEYEKGDIVTFKSKDELGNDMLIVHRIVDVATNAQGEKTYQTQGDNREMSVVPDQRTEDAYITSKDIPSVFYTKGYEGKILKGWGAPFDFLRSQTGFFFCVLLPMIIFFMYELIRVVVNAMNYKKAKADEDKEEAVKAAVAAVLADQNTTAAPAAETAGAAQSDNAGSSDPIKNLTPEQLEQLKRYMETQKQDPASTDPKEE